MTHYRQNSKMYPHIFISIFLLCTLHIFLDLDQKAKWFLMHSIANLIVVITTFKSAYYALIYPLDTDIIVNPSSFPSIFVLLLHGYHILMYPCNRMDYLHHSVMMFVLLFPIYFNSLEHYELSNYCLFFTCGLPGGIDYLFMYMVTKGHMNYITEKKWNTRLNTWIRAPGIMYGAFICWQHYLLTEQSLAIHIITSLTLLWNAQFFSNLTSLAYGYAKCKLDYNLI